jgi:effector-binding domain-containing protein
MYAAVGDRIVVRSVHLDGPVRDGEIVEVHGQHGAPPYVVRWSDTGHETLFFPGADATVRHFPHEEGDEDHGSYVVQTVQLQRQPVVVIKEAVRVEGIAEFMGKAFERVGKALAEAGVKPAGPPMGRYEMSEDMFTVEAGFPVHEALPVDAGLENGQLPGGLTARTVHAGSYATVDRAYHSLEKWAMDNGYQVRALPWESYLDEPDVPAPRTAVYLPLQEPKAAG